jgi:hypothetical protein
MYGSLLFSGFLSRQVLPGHLGRLGQIGIFHGAVGTRPHTFLAAGAGLRVFDMHVRMSGPIQFHQNSFRADCHTFPAAFSVARGDMDELRFTQMEKMEHIHHLS